MPKKPEQEPCALWKRLVEGLEARGLDASQTAVAGYAKVNQTSARKWMYGGPMTLENALALAKKSGLAVEYLLTGRGSKRPITGLGEQEEELLFLFSKMDAERREECVRYAKYLRTISHAADPEMQPKGDL